MSKPSGIVDELTSLDGSERWTLYRNEDGLYFASADVHDAVTGGGGEDWSGFDRDTGQHWVQDRLSGPFDTAEAAQHDALDSLPWFFEALTSNTNGS